jgi:hypothetical protein
MWLPASVTPTKYAIELAKADSNKARLPFQNGLWALCVVCDTLAMPANPSIAGRRAGQGPKPHGAALARTSLETNLVIAPSGQPRPPKYGFTST